jgi:exodeoxyribonuclease VII small subunit
MSDSLSFEASLAELEKLVALLEQANRPLEEQLAAFEKGVALSKDCFKKLEAAEKRVQQVLESADGTLVEAPLDAEED